MDFFVLFLNCPWMFFMRTHYYSSETELSVVTEFLVVI